MRGLAPLAPRAIEVLDGRGEGVVGLEGKAALRVLPGRRQPEAHRAQAAGATIVRPSPADLAAPLDRLDRPTVANAHAQRRRRRACARRPGAVQVRGGRRGSGVARAPAGDAQVEAAIRQQLRLRARGTLRAVRHTGRRLLLRVGHVDVIMGLVLGDVGRGFAEALLPRTRPGIVARVGVARGVACLPLPGPSIALVVTAGEVPRGTAGRALAIAGRVVGAAAIEAAVRGVARRVAVPVAARRRRAAAGVTCRRRLWRSSC